MDKDRREEMKKGKWKLVSVVAVLILAGLYYYIALPAINIHASEIWIGGRSGSGKYL